MKDDEPNMYKSHTVGSSELGDCIDEALVKLNRPAKPGLGVGGEDKAGVTLDTHGSVVGRIQRRGLLRMEHSLFLLS